MAQMRTLAQETIAPKALIPQRMRQPHFVFQAKLFLVRKRSYFLEEFLNAQLC